jgi:hypothetical protein
LEEVKGGFCDEFVECNGVLVGSVVAAAADYFWFAVRNAADDVFADALMEGV